MKPKQLKEYYTGDYRIGLLIEAVTACFSAPYSNPNNISYSSLTLPASHGIISNIYWKPEVQWECQEIVVLNRIDFGKPYGFTEININGKRGHFSRLPLVNVKYLIIFKGSLSDKSSKSNDNNMDKHCQIFCRRAINGTPYKPVYMGMGDFPANYFTVIKPSEWNRLKEESFYADKPDVDLGVMPLKYKYKDVDPEIEYKPVEIEDRIFGESLMHQGVILSKAL